MTKQSCDTSSCGSQVEASVISYRFASGSWTSAQAWFGARHAQAPPLWLLSSKRVGAGPAGCDQGEGTDASGAATDSETKSESKQSHATPEAAA
eukprot:CAMPEP_0177366254 /NCGR_PEP_ID=MMETSP0368-20130122/39757_1 /TAXON_ID=447022 ORGANISM="Scrippsiella hangoei-like, Strain SHHI-4" /NCGR_SAMPLE_ID=MMETSP0368 /ASSEMBLY_ACC=CAM_ASM_000363 /LENGTH=93 /DNA_ID=CAMNT_0018829233 /DNA_START=352 /DNA_END=630 /DNA_ORIENTATION=-